MARPKRPISRANKRGSQFSNAFTKHAHNTETLFMQGLYLCVNPFHAIWAVLCPAVESHWPCVFWASLLPRVAITKPIICLLNLSVGE